MSTKTRDTFIYAISAILSFLQALLVLVSKKISSNSGVLLFIFAAASLVWAIQSIRKENRRLMLAFIFYFAQLVLFLFIAPTIEIALVPRLLWASIILIHCAIFVVVLLGGLGITSFEKAILLASSTIFIILVSESLLGILDPTPPGNPLIGPEWSGALAPHPILGYIYRPHSELRTYYPGNPRGYFRRSDLRERMWNLRVVQPDAAKLEFPSDKPDAIIVDIIKETTQIPSDIQVNEPSFKIIGRTDYLVRFRARSDRERLITIGCANAHPPWNNLGLYEKLNVTENWQTFEKSFQANADDENARIHIDLGDGTPSVEIDSLSVENISTETPVSPALRPEEFFVSYQFNSLGCRGLDHSLNKPPETIRILLLGDSYTLGVGVHGQDTFGSHLEKILNSTVSSERKIKYEVINCGVSGYGTREERLFYKLFGERYHPDIVILSMVFNDDMSFWEEVERGYINRSPGKLELIFKIWGKIQDIHHRRPVPDFSKNVQEIILLNKDIERDRAHLLVDIFRNDRTYGGSALLRKTWNSLADTVQKGLQGTQIPVLDLGKALFKNPNQDLLVYEDLDDHPNEIAHRIAAEEIFRELQRLHWIEQ